MMGVALHGGVTLVKAEGSERVTALTWRAGPAVNTTECDAIGFGHGLRSETQLADLAGCTFEFSELEQAWSPTRGAAGRSSVRGVYLAGDGASILGADAAELSGARAALAALEDLGLMPAEPQRAAQIERDLLAHARFRRGLETAFAPPTRWAAEAPDELIVCRCEEVTAGELRACVRETGTREMNRLKALTRIGMGRCQGRMCAPAASRLLAHAAGCGLHEVGRIRGQAPIKPIPIAMLHDHAPSTLVPEDQDD
jgi:NADPH-dependent 2,4-dienoyl-CoA reductase/sulfur reductase-like enzyme